MANEEDKAAFKVEDRRRFDAGGEPREGDEQCDGTGSCGCSGPADSAGPSDGAGACDCDGQCDKGGACDCDGQCDSAGACDSGGACGCGDTAQAGAGEGRKRELSFSSFVVGLATQALVFMGAMPAPSGQRVEPNMGEASVIIDILSMFQRKTVGNLAEDEARLIEDVLYDLRMRFVRETHAKAEQGSQPE